MTHLDEAADLQRRFGGLERLYGVDGARAIRHAHVAVAGIGGVGSWAAEALARSGVSELTLIDLDHVAESNINRQVHALAGTVGQAKVVAMGERIARPERPIVATGCPVRTTTPESIMSQIEIFFCIHSRSYAVVVLCL